ncbi:hypothetical protein PMAYCL1PPCAC_08225, partial [Pristionchus mayeri]
SIISPVTNATMSTSQQRFIEALVKIKCKSYRSSSPSYLATIIVRPGEIQIVPIDQTLSSMVIKVDEMLERPERPVGMNESWVILSFVPSSVSSFISFGINPETKELVSKMIELHAVLDYALESTTPSSSASLSIPTAKSPDGIIDECS